MTRALTIAFAGLLVCVFSPASLASPKYDYCKMFDGEFVMFAIDRSDYQDEIDREIVTAAADKIFHELSSGDRLVVHTVTDDQTTSRKVFDACKPGCPEAGWVDQILGTCREAIARQDTVAFRNDFAMTMYQLVNTPEEHKGSAIIETIAALGTQYSEPGIDRFVLFSDLIQNSKLGNFLKMRQRDFEKARTNLEAWKLIPNLVGAKATVFGFGRTHGENRKGLPPEVVIRIEEFWRTYFQAAEVSAVTFNQRY